MPNTREKLIEVLGSLQDYGIKRTPGLALPGLPCNEIIADHLIANGVTIPEWIPVTERLPETAGKYLVWGKDVHGIGLHDAKYYLPPCPPDGLGGWCGKLNVTHWMPLPVPPAENN